MSKSMVKISDGRVKKSKSSKRQSKRSGNNLYGSKGKPKCEACRTARRGCEFERVDDVCGTCVRKGLPCGEKTRRGGAQETVRISVLEQLVIDHPAWTLRDVIAHLSGDEKCEVDDMLDGSASSADESYRSQSPCQLLCFEESANFDRLQLMHLTEPLAMEFATPEGAVTMMKREFTTATTTSMPATPHLVDDMHVPHSFDISEPFYPWHTIHPQCLDGSFQPEVPFDPSPQNPQLQLFIEENWALLPQAPYGESFYDVTTMNPQ